ncbi:MAG: hypothetical protein GTO51_08695 [Candidatus Latescibacteria bacterium]|nr:hypothetical protein [Candidatus Latescibacterota bacterium]NIM22030.1 hypothetical protein [Candidatus Latescibacterota bacterium]NIM66048.1 hypothetical protein [Candidatus Latescibacterota bacterium]NIO02456.1 hypothetical protein [Candidatus Latescibacterota bacterium]NIO29367.1 hypothetical protein [Candidatus Latescibacterota bacterium]
MKRASLFLVAIITLTALAWLPACQSPEVTEPTSQDLYTREQVPDLDDPYGGLNLADEAPAFGDPMMLEEFGESMVQEYDDPIANRAGVAEMMRHRLGRHYLMITWGNLERDTTITFWTEWSGSLTVDPGVIILRRIIRFEEHDQILPRERRDLLEWESFTGPAFDGIVVRIIPTSNLSSTDVKDSTSVVTFSTGPLAISFTIDELRDIHRVIQVDDAGNAVAFNSIYIPPLGCPKGFLGGIWKDDPDTTDVPRGTFRGMWMSDRGAHMGFLKGFYGLNSDGDRVFFGKWISLNGQFNGLLKGRWGPFPDAPGGFFEGVYLDRNLNVRGDLKGIWKKGDHISGGGFFKGRWATRCPTLTSS